MKKTENTYVFETGNADQERLAILNEVYNPSSQQLMLRSGITHSKHIVDMACGQGELTCWMAEQAPGSYVTGVDISEEQLQIARELATTKGLKNIQFIQASVFELDSKLFKLPPDFIYCRWLLSHFDTARAVEAIQKICGVLIPGGTVIHEEITLQESLPSPVSPAYQRWIKLFQDLATSLDISFDIGSDLLALVNNAGYQNITHQLTKPTFSARQKRFFALDIDCCKPHLVKLTTEQALEDLKNAIIHDQNQGYDMTMALWQVTGKNCS